MAGEPPTPAPAIPALPAPRAARSGEPRRAILPGGCVWPAAAVLIVAILAATWLLYAAATAARDVAQTTVRAPARVADALAGAFKPHVNISTVVQGSLTTLHATPKFVVLTPEFEVLIHKSSETTTLWGYVNLGTTTVALRAPGNRVQYYVPVNRITRASFRYEEAGQRLVVRIPRPVIDPQVVDVQSDPAKIEVETRNGWAKLDRYSGAPLREAARGELRDAVLRTGLRQDFREEADRRAKEEVARLFAPLSDSLREGVRLDVELE